MRLADEPGYESPLGIYGIGELRLEIPANEQADHRLRPPGPPPGARASVDKVAAWAEGKGRLQR